MLIVTAKARALPERREELLAAIREIVAGSRADEGCHSYGFYSDVEDEHTLMSIEIWQDEASLAAHMTHQHTTDFLARFPDLVDGPAELVSYSVHDAR